MFARVQSECGLSADCLDDVELQPGPAPVTGYTARGKERRTMVLSARALAKAGAKLTGHDASVSLATWCRLPLAWDRVAPANRLILARVLADRISQREKPDAIKQIDDALVRCNAWAADVGLPSSDHPWPS